MVRLVDPIFDAARTIGGPQRGLAPFGEGFSSGESLFSQVVGGQEGNSAQAGGSFAELVGGTLPAPELIAGPASRTGAPAGGGFLHGLGTNPLFSAGIEGLFGGNPLDGIRQAAVLKDRQQQHQARVAAAQREQAELRQLGAALQDAAEQSGDLPLRRLVAAGPKAYKEALKRLNAIGLEKARVLTTQEEIEEFGQDLPGNFMRAPSGEISRIPGTEPAKAALPSNVGGVILNPDGTVNEDLTQRSIAAGQAKRPVTSVTTNLPAQEEAEKKARGGQLVTQFGTVDEQATAAETAISQLEIARSLTQNNELLPEGIQGLANVAVSLGLGDVFDTETIGRISAGQGFMGTMQNMVLAKMQAQKGPQTENDAKRMERTVATLGNTPEARDFLLNSAIELARRDIGKRDFFEAHEAETGSLKGAARAYRDHITNIPLFGASAGAPQFPIFFSEFEAEMRAISPDISRSALIRRWRAFVNG